MGLKRCKNSLEVCMMIEVPEVPDRLSGLCNCCTSMIRTRISKRYCLEMIAFRLSLACAYDVKLL